MWLRVIFRLLPLLTKTDLFLVERAMLGRMMDPRLLALIEALVGDIDGSDIKGAEKKGAVLLRLGAAPDELGVTVRATADWLINKAIEFAVSALREAQRGEN